MALVTAIAGGCTLDYGALEEESSTNTPDLVMTDVEYVRVQDGKPVIRLQAESISRYDQAKRMDVDQPRFSQFDADGAEGARGGASSASINTETGDVSLKGAVVLSIPEEDVDLETDRLDWQDANRILAGDAKSPLMVKRKDGSYLTGSGFRVDSRSKQWSFSERASGTYVDEDQKSNPTEAETPAAPQVPPGIQAPQGAQLPGTTLGAGAEGAP